MEDVRQDWSQLAGRPGNIAVEMRLVVCETGDIYKPTHNAVVTVGVPNQPINDAEWKHLLSLFAAKQELSNAVQVAITSWKTVNGAHGVDVQRYDPIVTLTDEHLVGDIVVQHPAPAVADPHDIDESGELTKKWYVEYRNNPYLAFETREQLIERLDALANNMLVLTDEGLVDLTRDAHWYELHAHVICESIRRGMPFTKKFNRPIEVPHYSRFNEKEICIKAAKALRDKTLPPWFIVKYGKREHLRDFINYGLVRVASASYYDNAEHNAAIRDKEREFEFRGISQHRRTRKIVHRNEHLDPSVESQYDFVPSYHINSKADVDERKRLKKGDDVTFKFEMYSNYRLYCASSILDPSLVADFDADACVIVDHRRLLPRLIRAMRYWMPNSSIWYGNVCYQDSLGAYKNSASTIPHGGDFPTHRSKPFKYAYQKEWRVTWIPKPSEEHLQPALLELGSLKGFASLIDLRG